MGYRDKTINIDCEDLGDGCFILIKNPALADPADMTPRSIPLNPDGTPKSDVLARKATNEVIASLIVDWKVWDDNDMELPLPKDDPTVMDRVPLFILTRVGKEIQDRTNPPS